MARNPADPIFDEEEAQIRDAAARFEHASAEEILSWALEQFHPRMAISAAGGADGMVIVDMAWGSILRCACSRSTPDACLRRHTRCSRRSGTATASTWSSS